MGIWCLHIQKPDNLTAYLRGCRVCRNNVQLGWGSRNAFFFFFFYCRGDLTQWQDCNSRVRFCHSVNLGDGPILATTWKKQCSQTWHRTQYIGWLLASPLIAPLCSLDQLCDLRWTLDPLSSSITWIKMDHHEITWNHTCENNVK